MANWTQIGWGCVFGLVVGLVVYALGSYMDYRRDRRWRAELDDVETLPPLPRRTPGAHKTEENDPDGA